MREGHGTLIDEMGTYIGEWKQDQVFTVSSVTLNYIATRSWCVYCAEQSDLSRKIRS
jgi:hypothetical protein